MSTLDNVVELPQASRPKWEYALVPDGEHVGYVTWAETWTKRERMGWAPRLIVWWRLVDEDVLGMVLPASYHLNDVHGKRRYKMPLRGRLAMDLAAMLGCRPPTDRFPLNEVRSVQYRIVTRTVTETSQDYGVARRELPAAMRYSVVQHVIGEAG